MTEETPDRPVSGAPGEKPGPGEEQVQPEPTVPESTVRESTATEDVDSTEPVPAAEPEQTGETASAPSSGPSPQRRRRDLLASVLIGVLTLLLGFAFAVQVRSADSNTALAGAREEDLVRILDELNSREERVRDQINEQRTALEQLTNTDSQSATALQEAKRRAEAIGILNGTIAARGPGLRMTVQDPSGAVRVEDVLDAIEELRGAGAETMQIGGVRVGVSTAVTGRPGHLMIDGRPITAPYEFLVIGSPQNMETAMNIPGGVVQRITGLGGAVQITQVKDLTVDALRPLDTPQYAAPTTGG